MHFRPDPIGQSHVYGHCLGRAVDFKGAHGLVYPVSTFGFPVPWELLGQSLDSSHHVLLEFRASNSVVLRCYPNVPEGVYAARA